MANRIADVKIETSIDLTLDERIEGAALDAFDTTAREMKQAIWDQWKGWRYEGMSSRAVAQQTRRSRDAWGYELQATEDPRTITFINKARSYYGNKPYAGYVARSKMATKEWILVQAMLVEKHLPVLRDRMIQAIQDAIRTPGRRVKVRENKTSSYKRFSLDS